MSQANRRNEVQLALSWYFDSKGLALKNALAIRSPLSEDQSRELRQYYGQYFSDLVSAAELLLEKEYPNRMHFSNSIKAGFAFNGFLDGESNYSYLRELRNSIIHRGLAIDAAVHFRDTLPLLVAPEVVSSRSGSAAYNRFAFYVLDIISKCESTFCPLIYGHAKDFGLLEPAMTKEEMAIQVRDKLAGASHLSQQQRQMALDGLDHIDFSDVLSHQVESLVRLLSTNVFAQLRT